MRPSTQKPRDAGPPRNQPSADEHGGSSSTAQSPQTQRANGGTAGRSWRDVLPVHPAAELFPLMSPDELRELGEDIKKRGLQIPILIRGDELLDGRNRLDAMELVGVPFQLTKEDFGWDLKVGPDQYRVERLFDWSDPYAGRHQRQHPPPADRRAEARADRQADQGDRSADRRDGEGESHHRRDSALRAANAWRALLVSSVMTIVSNTPGNSKPRRPSFGRPRSIRGLDLFDTPPRVLKPL